MLYVFDMTDRLVALARDASSSRARRGRQPSRPSSRSRCRERSSDLHAAAMRLHALDPVTTELVRLHCARYHDCKT